MDNVKVRELEEEQERLNNSLFSLTTHFAQVQFRLKQIAEANGEDKEVSTSYMSYEALNHSEANQQHQLNHNHPADTGVVDLACIAIVHVIFWASFFLASKMNDTVTPRSWEFFFMWLRSPL